MTTQVDETRPREVKRKLTAILSADVKGYSRLMGEDEKGTLRTLNVYKEVMTGLIEHHHGRVVDAPGDNVLAEFASVVDAVECAVEVQKELKTRNADLPENRRMEFRIGVNLGDVIEEEGKIFGDGVNIAARLENLSDAGGICISGKAYDEVKSKLNFGYKYVGEQTVKNITEPIRTYQVLMEPEAAGRMIGEKKAKPRQWQRVSLGLVAAVIVVIAAVVIWKLYMPPSPQREVASKEKMAFPLPDKPSIAVLPFSNMSGDPKKDYLSDGLAEEIINALTRLPQVFVIARNSTFTYKGRAVDVKQVSREMGVKYVMEGSVQWSDGRVRITAQLVDATIGHHVFSERYDRELKDLFALQDDITLKVLAAMQVRFSEGEQARMWAKGTKNLEAYLKLLQAVEHRLVFNKESQALALRLAEEAIALDPGYALPYSTAAMSIAVQVLLGVYESPQEVLSRAWGLAQKAVSLNDSLAQAHVTLGFLYVLYKRDHEKGIAEAERAVALEPNSRDAYMQLATQLVWAGRAEESIPLFKKAMRLSPIHTWVCLNNVASAYRNIGQYDEAIAIWKGILERQPDQVLCRILLSGTLVLAGRQNEARAEAAEVMRQDPGFSLERFGKTFPWKNKDDIERLIIEPARKAGLPEKPSASIPPSAEVAPKEKIAVQKSEKVSKPVTPTPPKEEVASKDKMAFPLPDDPSIAVMPFVNMSGDPKQEFLSDGITENIITALSKVPRLLVISRQSTFFYKGKPVKVKQVSEELGVRYVLEGSVQRSADRIRINAQLIDALTGRHIWAERYDRDLEDLFAIQDEITLRILTAVQVKLTLGGQVSGPTKYYGGKQSLDCYLKLTEAAGYFNRWNIQDNNLARRLIEEVIAMCPDIPNAYSQLATVNQRDYWLGNTKSPRETLEKGIELAQKAIAMDDSLFIAHAMLCNLYSIKKEYDKAIAEGERALALNSGSTVALVNYALVLIYTGRPEEAIPLHQKALRLNPFPPSYLYLDYGQALRNAGRSEEAVSALKKAIQIAPDNFAAHLHLAATYSMMGRVKEAGAEAAEVLRVNPKFSLDSYANRLAYKDQSQADKLINALRKAGLK